MELTLSDISAVIRLVREVCDRWDDPRAWREHLLLGACRLLDGHAAMMVVDDETGDGYFGRPRAISVVGVPAPMRALVDPALAQWERRSHEEVSQSLMPGMGVLYGDMLRQGWTTRTRGQIADDEAYHAAAYYRDFRRKIDCDDYIVSIRVVDVMKRPEAINVDRPHGAPRFGEREVAILKLLHDEITPLIGTRLATEDHLSRDGLSRRLSQTLSLLLEGQSEKEVAGAMGLSPRTVHEYVTTLYQHFRVSSRAELLAYFIRRTPVLRGVDSI